MELYLPSLMILIAAAIVVFFVFPKLTPLMLAVLAMVALVYVLYNHYTLFGQEYQLMTWIDGAKAAAPYVMVTTLVVFIIGYLLFVFGSGRKVELPTPPPMNLPSPESATNPLTEGINRALVNTGIANRGPNNGARPPNNSKNLVSVSPSLNEGLNRSRLNNIIRSRLNKQI
jgi:hypothetical protein